MPAWLHHGPGLRQKGLKGYPPSYVLPRKAPFWKGAFSYIVDYRLSRLVRTP